MYKIIDKIPDGIDEKDIIEEHLFYTKSWNQPRTPNWDYKKSEYLKNNWNSENDLDDNLNNYYWIMNSKNIYYIPARFLKEGGSKDLIVEKEIDNKKIYLILHLSYKKEERYVMWGGSECFPHANLGEIN